jgi:hypothetical protein
MRYIALGNWIMQSCLKPLHDLIFQYIRTLKSDCTFDQNKVFP